jgi:hypothetical protein
MSAPTDPAAPKSSSDHDEPISVVDANDCVEYLYELRSRKGGDANSEKGDANSDNDETLKVYTDPSGKCRAGVGATIWDAALVVSRFLEKTYPGGGDKWASTSTSTSPAMAALPQSLRAKRIVELGSGTGIVSVVAAKLGGDVVATDQTFALPLLQLNARANFDADSKSSASLVGDNDATAAGRMSVAPLPWGDTAAASMILEKGGVDIIVGSDVVVWAPLSTKLLATIDALMGLNNPIDPLVAAPPVFILSHEHRNADTDDAFFTRLRTRVGSVCSCDVHLCSLHSRTQISRVCR